MCLSSCTHRVTDFTIISTKNYPIGRDAASLKKASFRVKGVDKTHTVLMIPFGTPNLKEAIDRAIEAYPGAVGLSDGVVKNKSWFVFLYGQNSFIVEGTPVYPDEKIDGSLAQQQVPPVAAAEAETLVLFHEVKSGDTLQGVAASYGVSIKDIIRWNQMSSTEIKAGEKLKILMK